MRERDILVHHPYDSFTTSVERFVRQAVEDPNVLAIKQTVYRTSSDSPLVPGLIEATERGKQAVCLVELKARFDESANIRWAKSLEEAGVHVVYGIPGLKTHVKCILVARREGDGVRNYVHIGTGNYNPKTARLYTDVGLFTADPEIGADIAEMFNYLTGYARPKNYRKVLVAPFSLKDGIVGEIERRHRGALARAPVADQDEDELAARPGLHPGALRGLAGRASRSTSTCAASARCGRGSPASPRTSASSRSSTASSSTRGSSPSRAAASAGSCIGSADLMPRNLYNRVELLSPVEDPQLQDQLGDVLDRSFADNTSSWELNADGRWAQPHPRTGSEPRNLQREMMELTPRSPQSPSPKASEPGGALLAWPEVALRSLTTKDAAYFELLAEAGVEHRPRGAHAGEDVRGLARGHRARAGHPQGRAGGRPDHPGDRPQAQRRAGAGARRPPTSTRSPPSSTTSSTTSRRPPTSWASTRSRRRWTRATR